MALTKISGDVIQSSLTLGIATATSLNVGTGVTIQGSGATFTGVVTATTFSGNATSATLATNAQGLTGTPNITVGSITAASATFSGNISVAGTVTYEDVTNVDSVGVVTARSGIHVTSGNVGIGTENPGLNLKLDIFQTSGGNAVSISNNSALAFRDTAGTARRAAFLSGTNNYYYGDADNVIADSNLFLHANNSVSLFTNGTPYVTLQKNGSFRVGSSGTTISAITSTGLVGIGTTNPDQNLVVFNPTTTCRIRTKATASNTGVDFQQAADGTGYLWNRDNGSIRLGTNDTERLHILPNGNIALPGRTITRNGSNTVITASGSYLECIGYKDYNASSFNMFDIVGVSNHTSISIEIRHGHEGGGQHGSWMRYVAALNAYTDIMVNYNSTHNYNGGNGFTVTRPQYNTIRIAWNGASSFSESFYMAARIWLGRNQDTPTLSNQSMTNFSSSYNYS